MTSRSDASGNSAEDWMIFETLCGGSAAENRFASSPLASCSASSTPTQRIDGGAAAALVEHHHGTSLDLVTTLRSELAALSCKRDRLCNELADTKNALCSRDAECEALRAQAARQSALIGSLQARLQAAEGREQSVQTRCDATVDALQREKRAADERAKELQCRAQLLETRLAGEEALREQSQLQLHELLRRLGGCLGLEACDSAQLSAECVATRVEELTLELQRHKAKMSATCDTLSSCETELLNLKSLANIEKQRLSAQLESGANRSRELEARCRQYERDLQLQRDRLTEAEIGAEQLREELRGFESRCHRLQNNADRAQSDRLQLLRGLAVQLDVAEPCETLVRDKLREALSENQVMHLKLHALQDTHDAAQSRLRCEEARTVDLEARLAKCDAEILALRQDHVGLSAFLQRVARALDCSDCATPPALGSDTNALAEELLQRIEQRGRERSPRAARGRSSAQFSDQDACCLRPHAHQHQHQRQPLPTPVNLRRERSCHDIPLKESCNVYTLQRRVRLLREQLQRRDVHLELLRRKLALVEDGARGKCALQAELEDAVSQLRRATKHGDRLGAQLAEVKAQLAESADHKISALERARKIDELTTRLCAVEADRTRLQAQLSSSRERLRLAADAAQNRRARDETLINSLHEDVTRLQAQLSEANLRLSQLQAFRGAVARTLHLRDLPETDLLQRLQALCSAQQEFALLSRRFEDASPALPPPPPPPTTKAHSCRHRCQRSKSRPRDKHRHDACCDADGRRLPGGEDDCTTPDECDFVNRHS